MAEKYYEKSLKELKSKKNVPQWLLDEVKIQNRIKADILKAVALEGKTVPEIAREINVPGEKVLWFISALRKYGKITESGKKGNYYLYIKK